MFVIDDDEAMHAVGIVTQHRLPSRWPPDTQADAENQLRGHRCCSPHHALLGLPRAFFRGLGRLVWSKQSCRPSHFDAGSWRENLRSAAPEDARYALVADLGAQGRKGARGGLPQEGPGQCL
jgi:hypothetical protein